VAGGDIRDLQPHERSSETMPDIRSIDALTGSYHKDVPSTLNTSVTPGGRLKLRESVGLR
jgi:hypothetical protein